MGRCKHGCYDFSVCSLCNPKVSSVQLRRKQKADLYRYKKEAQDETILTAVNHRAPWILQDDVVEDILRKDCSLASKSSIDITKEIAELSGRRLYAVSIMWIHWYKPGQLGSGKKDIDRELVIEIGTRLGLSRTREHSRIILK